MHTTSFYFLNKTDRMPKIDAVNSMTVEGHSALRYANNYANYISKSCDLFLELRQ